MKKTSVCWETKEKNGSILMKAASMKELEILATMDPLTRCYNQQKFDEILSKEIIDSEQFNHHFSLILFTINHAKDITEQFGYQESNDILVIISTIIQQRIRENDILARWTDEEFILLLPDTVLQNAKELAESIQSIIGNFRFQRAGFVKCCFGISEFQTGTSKQTLLLDAKKGLLKMASIVDLLTSMSHQWVQAINRLSLLIQDVKGAIEFGEVSDDYINTFISESMAQINLLTLFLSDFRDFYRPAT